MLVYQRVSIKTIEYQHHCQHIHRILVLKSYFRGITMEPQQSSAAEGLIPGKSLALPQG